MIRKMCLLIAIGILYISYTRCLIVQISIMKSGTHLLIPLIQQLTKKKSFFATSNITTTTKQGRQDAINVTPRDFKRCCSLPNKYFWITHCPCVQAYAEILSQPKYQIIYLYRDPRDVVVSLALYIRTKDKKWWPKALELSLEETITRIIEGGDSLHVTDHHISKYGIRTVYDAYMPWATQPTALAIRFEDLIGPQGGGNREQQINSILAIAHHVGIDLEEYEATLLAESLFDPNAFSFNKGQIGSWKEYFTQKQKDLFKEHAGQLLIDLGYEKDLNW